MHESRWKNRGHADVAWIPVVRLCSGLESALRCFAREAGGFVVVVSEARRVLREGLPTMPVRPVGAL